MSEKEPRTLPPELAPARALAWSEWALEWDAVDAPTMALWRPGGVHVALGLAQIPEKEIRLERDGTFSAGLVRRQSGGGAVLLYPGVLCWEAMADLGHIREIDGDDGIRAAYRVLSRPVIDGLERLGVRAFSAGVSDLSVDGSGDSRPPRKIAGTAQLRRRRRVLVHGALLVDADIAALSRYLLMPSVKPEYRGERSHRDFCASVRELLLERGRDCAGLLEKIAEAAMSGAARAGWKTVKPPSEPDPEAIRLEKMKYMNPEWNWRRDRSALLGKDARQTPT